MNVDVDTRGARRYTPPADNHLDHRGQAMRQMRRSGIVRWAFVSLLIAGAAPAGAQTFTEPGDAGDLVPTAAVVPAGTTKIIGSLGPQFEVDLYRLTFPQRSRATFSCHPTGEWFDEDFTLFDEVGHPVLVSDYAFTSDLAAGTYHLALTDWDALATDAAGNNIADDYSNVLNRNAILGGWQQTGWPFRYGPYEINLTIAPIPEPSGLPAVAALLPLLLRRRSLKRAHRARCHPARPGAA